MASFVVTFEVANPLTRTSLTEEIKKAYPAYCPIHENCWAVVSNNETASQIRDRLVSKIAASDRLFVVRSGTEGAWINTYGPKNSDWLKKYL